MSEPRRYYSFDDARELALAAGGTQPDKCAACGDVAKLTLPGVLSVVKIPLAPIAGLWRCEPCYDCELAASTGKPWRVCDNCGQDWCDLHTQHVRDCGCPPAKEWDSSPYQD